MKTVRIKTLAGSMSLLFWLASAQAAFVPWDVLSADNWISGVSTPTEIHTVNGSTYDLAFSTYNAGVARGMNAVQFSDGINNTGHLFSMDMTGSFRLDNTGGKNWTHVLILVAIDADSLGPDFAFNLSTDGGFSYDFDPSDDFCFYNGSQYDTGRPSGYYSDTNPDAEGIAYCFDAGMLSVFELPNIAIASHDSFTVNYAFDHLPGRAVFSAYADQGTAFQITHTNRSSPDLNDPAAEVSTFEVIPEPVTFLLLVLGAYRLTGKKHGA